MQILNERDTLIFSSGELYVLAGLMGYKSIFGVGGDRLDEWKHEMKKHVHDVVDRLEKRMIVLIDLSGDVNLEYTTEKMIHCLCMPEFVGRFVYTDENGRKTESWFMYDNENELRVDRITVDAYRLSLVNPGSENVILNNFFTNMQSSNIHERLSLLDVGKVRNRLNAFDRAGASEVLRNFLTDPSSEREILALLSGTSPFLRIQCRLHRKNYYRNALEILMVRGRNSVLRFSQKGKDVCFDSACVSEISRIYADVLIKVQ